MSSKQSSKNLFDKSFLVKCHADELAAISAQKWKINRTTETSQISLGFLFLGPIAYSAALIVLHV